MTGVIESFLAQTPVSEFPVPPHIVSVQSDSTLLFALRTLIRANILSCPVYKDEACLGFIDLVDIVAEVCAVYEAKKLFGDFYGALMNDEILGAVTVGECIDKSKRNPFCPVSTDSSLLDIVRAMAHQNIRRIPVVDSQGRILNVITQSAVIDFLSQNLGSLGTVANQTMDQLDIKYKKKVAKVHCNTKAIAAFNLMVFHGISSVAVYDDDEDTPITSVTVRDLRALLCSETSMRCTDLYISTGEFISKIRQEHKETTKHPTISCREGVTFKQLLDKLKAARIHHIFVVDDDGKFTGIVSTQDIIRPLPHQ